MNKELTSTLLLALVLVLSFQLSACGKNETEKPKAEKPAPAKITPPTDPLEQQTATAETPTVEMRPTETTSEPKPVQEVTPAAPLTISNREKSLALAKKSGCLACHSIDKKLVGPAWKDVAARYKGNSEARSMLIEKVSGGGKGNWGDITGGVPMPPYYPRVTKENIERLVDFVLSL